MRKESRRAEKTSGCTKLVVTSWQSSSTINQACEGSVNSAFIVKSSRIEVGHAKAGNQGLVCAETGLCGDWFLQQRPVFAVTRAHKNRSLQKPVPATKTGPCNPTTKTGSWQKPVPAVLQKPVSATKPSLCRNRFLTQTGSCNPHYTNRSLQPHS
jgi:hypothetical protein